MKIKTRFYFVSPINKDFVEILPFKFLMSWSEKWDAIVIELIVLNCELEVIINR
jgi:hypothetical protein